MTQENPIRLIRTKQHKTLKEFAEEIGIHHQALFLNEQGVYPHVLPEIVRFIRAGNPHSFSYLDEQYTQFQLEKRTYSGQQYEISRYNLDGLGDPDSNQHPVAQFRRGLGHFGVSRMGFSKAFCIHPAELYSLEHCQKFSLSEQFQTAMRQAGLDDLVLEELKFRCAEFAMLSG